MRFILSILSVLAFVGFVSMCFLWVYKNFTLSSTLSRMAYACCMALGKMKKLNVISRLWKIGKSVKKCPSFLIWTSF